MILGLIIAALAIAVLYAIKITYDWFDKKIHEKLNKKNTKKVFSCAVENLIAECEKSGNVVSYKELEKLRKSNLAMATINNKDEVEDLELVKNTDAQLDKEVESLLGSRKQIVVTN